MRNVASSARSPSWRRQVSASSTTVTAPTFDELRAPGRERRGREGRGHAGRRGSDSRSGRSIVTDVTVAIEQTIKGPDVRASARSSSSAAPSATTRCRVEGMPQFCGRRSRRAVHQRSWPAGQPARRVHDGRFRIMRIRDRCGHGADPRRTAAGGHRRRRQRQTAGPRRSQPRTLTLADFVGAIRDKARIQAQAAR
mgnify:CR=1 FL=1